MTTDQTPPSMPCTPFTMASTRPRGTLIYAEQEVEPDGVVVAICPRCSERIPLIEPKDFESFAGSEYAAHCAAEHAEDNT